MLITNFVNVPFMYNYLVFINIRMYIWKKMCLRMFDTSGGIWIYFHTDFPKNIDKWGPKYLATECQIHFNKEMKWNTVPWKSIFPFYIPYIIAY